MSKVSILFVCLGNICRSPLAEGVFRAKVKAAGLADDFVIDSAGTGGWHIGAKPDERMRQTAQRHGISLDNQRARRVEPTDFDRFDYLLAMDHENVRALARLAQRGRAEVRLFREYDPIPQDGAVPDPYYGGAAGFEHVYTIVDRTTTALLAQICAEKGFK